MEVTPVGVDDDLTRDVRAAAAGAVLPGQARMRLGGQRTGLLGHGHTGKGKGSEGKHCDCVCDSGSAKISVLDGL